ncbi:hypothetical protein MRB53_034455 [Persea americana]|uniref:Uncharacterized protein n=1 Tax=Persea americana TaxID=3435 RepID=A0ACC2K1T2_PERAE|nr:hypothetical protein MRB53_034455 [Persea americana]
MGKASQRDHVAVRIESKEEDVNTLLSWKGDCNNPINVEKYKVDVTFQEALFASISKDQIINLSETEEEGNGDPSLSPFHKTPSKVSSATPKPNSISASNVVFTDYILHLVTCYFAEALPFSDIKKPHPIPIPDMSPFPIPIQTPPPKIPSTKKEKTMGLFLWPSLPIKQEKGELRSASLKEVARVLPPTSARASHSLIQDLGQRQDTSGPLKSNQGATQQLQCG